VSTLRVIVSNWHIKLINYLNDILTLYRQPKYMKKKLISSVVTIEINKYVDCLPTYIAKKDYLIQTEILTN
jgi:hypothetical protein